MATKELCSLIVKLELKPWYSEPKEYVIYKGSLNAIDNYTMKYQDKYALYGAVKEELVPKINRDSIDAFGLVPIEINLIKPGIFVRKADKDVRALFEFMDYGGNVYSLFSLVLSAMMKGGLKALYLCDKRRSDDPNYQVIFKDNLKYIGERIEIDATVESDYVHVLNELETRRKYSEIVRFLLKFLQMKPEDLDSDEIYSMFLADVSDEEHYDFSSITTQKEDSKGYYYRYPYKD